MDFSQALQQLKSGLKVSRSGWNGKDMFLFLMPEGKVNHPILGTEAVEAAPFIAIYTVQKTVVPWLASQADLMASDYHIIQ